MNTRAIGEKLEELMDEKNISTLELAYGIGVNIQTLDRWIGGTRQITVYGLKRCAEYFGVSMDELAEGV